MIQNLVDFKAKSFLTERNTSSIAYEVKGVRAIWDPGLSIPGTDRRGGWRCPVGTRYGGQITDRFGRSCGWGVARRIANQISDIGQRLENVDDARRGRRIARRERRILARLNPQDRGAGRLERGLRGVAERLEGGDAPSPRGARRRTVVARTPSIDTPEAPRELTPEPVRPARPARRRAPARPQGGGNLRESEQRRMEREIEQPGAPRTGEAPARRRRRAVTEATRKPRAPRRQQEQAAQPEAEPRVVTPRRPRPAENVDLVKRPKRRKPAGSDNAANSERMRQARADRARGAGQEVDIDRILRNPNKREFASWIENVVLKQQRLNVINDSDNFPNNRTAMRNAFGMARMRIDAADMRLEKIQTAINRGEIGENDFVTVNGERINIARLTTLIKDHRDGWQEVADALESRPSINPNNAPAPERREPLGVPLLDNNAFDNFIQGWIPALGQNLTADERQAMREQWDAEEAAVDDVRRFFRRRLVDEDFGGPDDLRERINLNLQEIQKAQDRMDRDVSLVENGATGQRKADALNRIIVNAQDRRRRVLENEFMEQAINDASPSSPSKPTPKPQAKPNPIDDPFNAPSRRDIRGVPDELKHVPPKMEAAKFKKEDEDLIEEVLLQIRDPKLLGELGLAADQAIFNRNEGRQAAVRNFQIELLRVADVLRANPNADVAPLIAEAKRKYMGYVRPQGGVAAVRTKLNELETQLSAEFRLLRSPLGNGAEAKEINRVATMKKIAQLQSDIGKYEGHLQLIDALEPEIRKASERRKQGFIFNPDATNIPKPLAEDVAKKINDQINEAIERRQGKLAKYLKQRHPNGGAPYEDMTPAKWGTLTAAQKKDYLTQAYSHARIEGKNGKLYRATATVSPQNGFQIQVQFDEINDKGEVIRAKIATSSRSVSVSQGTVSQNSMFVTSKIDRGADIQTIYNQHAFLYLKKIGVTKANVNAADDGQYVWARVGFKRGSGLSNNDLQVLQNPLKFYEDFGPGGLISNDAEYARIKSILAQARGGKRYHHQDIIFALDDPTGDRARMEYVKQWFKANLGFGGGTLSFAEQKIGEKLAKKKKTPRPRIRVEPPRVA